MKIKKGRGVRCHWDVELGVCKKQFDKAQMEGEPTKKTEEKKK